MIWPLQPERNILNYNFTPPSEGFWLINGCWLMRILDSLCHLTLQRSQDRERCDDKSQTNCRSGVPRSKQSTGVSGKQSKIDQEQSIFKPKQSNLGEQVLKTIKFDQNGYQKQNAPPTPAPSGRGRAWRSCVWCHFWSNLIVFSYLFTQVWLPWL